MYPAIIENYLAPKTVQEALRALATGGGDTHFIAGGQSLMQAIKARLVSPKCLIDLQHVSELKGITSEGGGTRIGAMTRYREIAAAEHDPVAAASIQLTAEIIAECVEIDRLGRDRLDPQMTLDTD